MAEPRRLLFAAVVAALVAALLLGLRPSGSSAPTAPTPGPPTATPGAPRTPAEALRRAARRFLTAFLLYEVGGGGTRTRAGLRTESSPALAGELLEGPRPLHTHPGRATITALHLDPLPGHPGLALVSGEAHRPAGAEPFAFLFGRRAGRWLALAPGE